MTSELSRLLFKVKQKEFLNHVKTGVKNDVLTKTQAKTG